jgi:hypothetical protein
MRVIEIIDVKSICITFLFSQLFELDFNKQLFYPDSRCCHPFTTYKDRKKRSYKTLAPTVSLAYRIPKKKNYNNKFGNCQFYSMKAPAKIQIAPCSDFHYFVVLSKLEISPIYKDALSLSTWGHVYHNQNRINGFANLVFIPDFISPFVQPSKNSYKHTHEVNQ